MGVAAPKDPEKKRMGFYIMRNKDIFGSPAQSGGGVQFLYQSDGRIVNSAKLVGGIEDDGMLSMLVKTEDFKKLVYSIGVTVRKDGSLCIRNLNKKDGSGRRHGEHCQAE